MTMRLSIAFFISIISLYMDFPFEELENLMTLLVDEGFGFHSDYGWKLTGVPAIPFSSFHVHDYSLVSLVFYHPGKELFSGMDILGSIRSRFLISSGACCAVGLGSRTVCSSIVPRDLSSRNKF